MSQITVTQTFVKSLLTSWICIMCNLFDNQNMLPFSSWRVMIVSFQASVPPSCHWQWMERTQFIILAQRSKCVSLRLRRACDVLSWPWCHHVTSQKSHGIARGSRYEPGHPCCLRVTSSRRDTAHVWLSLTVLGVFSRCLMPPASKWELLHS